MLESIKKSKAKFYRDLTKKCNGVITIQIFSCFQLDIFLYKMKVT